MRLSEIEAVRKGVAQIAVGPLLFHFTRLADSHSKYLAAFVLMYLYYLLIFNGRRLWLLANTSSHKIAAANPQRMRI